MPTTLTIPLTASAPLFFDEVGQVEELFLEILAQAPAQIPPSSLGRAGELKPYTLSPFWPERQRGLPALEKIKTPAYQWRVCLLEDGLVTGVLAGLETVKTLKLNSHLLEIGQAAVDAYTYEGLAQGAQRQAKENPQARRYLDLEFLTPVILRRLGLPMPLPDPVLVFHSYLHVWDTFAPRELWVNINVLDAIEAHLGLIEHQLETRPVKLAEERVKTGFLGRVTYKMMAWEKLGVEFLGTLHMLAHFGEFCGTGELTESGLGQTRYGRQGRQGK